jgi:hypothetical protein
MATLNFNFPFPLFYGCFFILLLLFSLFFRRLNRLLFGMESAFWFHIVNVALHSFSSILFTRICSQVAGFKPNYSLIAGIFFAVHPIHTESKFQHVVLHFPSLLPLSAFSPLRRIGHCRKSGTFRMYVLLAFLSFLSWVRDEIFTFHALNTNAHCRFLFDSHKKDPDDRSLWISIVLGGLAMLAKESGLTVRKLCENWILIGLREGKVQCGGVYQVLRLTFVCGREL